MPRGARILSFQVQKGEPFIWALVDTEQPADSRKFYLVGTGHPFSPDPNFVRFIGTIQLEVGNFVFHLFEPEG